MGVCKLIFYMIFSALFCDRLFQFIDKRNRFDLVQQDEITQNQSRSLKMNNEQLDLVSKVLSSVMNEVNSFNLDGLQTIPSLNLELGKLIKIYMSEITLYSFKNNISLTKSNQGVYETHLVLTDIQGEIKFNKNKYIIKIQFDDISSKIQMNFDETTQQYKATKCQLDYHGFDLDLGLVSVLTPFKLLLNNFLTQQLLDLVGPSLVDVANEYVLDIFNHQYYSLKNGKFSLDLKKFEDEPKQTDNNTNNNDKEIKKNDL